jgi:LPXTG-motif cell wall-anchored protein
MNKWMITFICLAIGLLLPVSSLADSHDAATTQVSADTSILTEENLATAKFDVTGGFEQQVNLEGLTTLQWTFVKGEATALYTVELPGQQLPATGWKDFYVNLGWDIAQTNAQQIAFSDGTYATLYSQVIGNSGQVRFWMDAPIRSEKQELEVESEVSEQGIQLRFSVTGYYIIWINGHEFARVYNNQMLIDKFLIKGSNRITIESTDDQFASHDTRAIYRLFLQWNKEASADVEAKQLIQVIVPTKDGKALGRSVELSFQWIAEEPMPEGIWYIWVDQNAEALQTNKSIFTLSSLSPGTHQVKIELRTQNGEVIGGTETLFVVPTQSGGILPNTATSWPKTMAFGLVLLLAGAFVWRRWARGAA